MNSEPIAKRRGLMARLEFPFHSLLVSAFPILSVFTMNTQEITLASLYRPLAVAVLGTAVLWMLLTVICRDIRKAAIAASTISLAFFSYGHIKNVLPHSMAWTVTPALLAALAVGFYILFRASASLNQATLRLNQFSVVLIAPALFTVISDGVLGPQFAAKSQLPSKGYSRTTWSPVEHKTSLSVAEASKLPDVYYIVLDAYGRADSLKEFYGFDNTPFIRQLEKRGFFVANKSPSNYDQTTLCLASALNMGYLDGPAIETTAKRGGVDARDMLDNSAVAEFLRKLDYKYVYVWTNGETTRVKTADVVLGNESKVSNLDAEAFSMTPLSDNPAVLRRTYDEARANLSYGFDNLDDPAEMKGRKFVLAHILAPHPPFVFGPNGEAVNSFSGQGEDASMLLRSMSRDEYRQGYIGQLQYVNRRVLEAIDSILAKSKRRPIIILQGDHGSRMSLDWDRLDKTDVREPFSILNAYLVPDSVRAKLYPKISPVNSFRILLSEKFGAALPTLPDQTFYSSVDNPGVFTEVTQQLARAWAN